MTRITAVLMFLACLALFTSVPAGAVSLTCDECREFDKKRAQTQMELARKERQLDKAFKKKEFRKVTGIREHITELRRKLLTLKSREPECKIACRPDVVKEAYCKKIIGDIVKMNESQLMTKEDRDKIDERYRDLADCNRDWEKLRSLHKKGRSTRRTR